MWIRKRDLLQISRALNNEMHIAESYRFGHNSDPLTLYYSGQAFAYMNAVRMVASLYAYRDYSWLARIVIIVGAIIFFLGGCTLVAWPVNVFNLHLSLSVVGGFLVGIATVFLSIKAWDRWG